MITRLRTSVFAPPLVCLLLTLVARYSVGYPGPVSATAAPVLGPRIQTTEIPSGTFSVSTRTGAAQYAYPIVVPPGRQGMQPALGLSYSSQNPLRGGVAAGWRLDLPSIRVDTSAGRLTGTRYLSTLAGGQRLIPVDEPARTTGIQTFRAEQDASYTRYERVQIVPAAEFFWRALRTDGTTYFFGDDPSARDSADVETDATQGRWFASRIVDRLGNQVAFQYEKVLGSARNGELQGIPVDIALVSAEYTANSGAGLLPHARIEFEYAPQLDLCRGSAVPIGAQFDYRTGIRIYEGARRLNRITTRVRQTPGGPFRTRRIVELSYDQKELECSPTGTGLHAPLRLLIAIRERGFNLDGEETALPPVTFTYGALEHNFSESTSIPALAATDGDVTRGKEPLNRNKAGGWPTIDAMLADLNGDARPDLLRSRESQQPQRDVLCSVQWQRNAGGGVLGEPAIEALPTLPWANASPGSPFGFRNDGVASEHLLESCNLAFQFTRRTNKPVGGADEQACLGLPSNYLSYRFLDLDGDGDLDLATALDYKRGRYSPSLDPVLGRVDLHGKVPPCPPQPPCRDPSGDPVACLTRVDSGVLFLGTGDPFGTGPCGHFVIEECPDPNDPGCFDNDPDTPCNCSPDNCGQPVPPVPPIPPSLPVREVVGSEWDPPALDDGFLGAPFMSGDVGHEDAAPGLGGNPWCSQSPEMACAIGEGSSGLERQSRFMYIWRVHWNVGDGIFPQQEDTNSASPAEQPLEIATTPHPALFRRKPDIHLSPVPLETDRPVSPTGNEPASSWTGFIDIDGDGFLDAVWQDPVAFEPHTGPTGWPGRKRTGRYLVFRGDGKGNFLPKPNGNPYEWKEPHLAERPRISLERAGFTNRRTNGELHRSTDTLVTLEDVNGDGLPDLIDSRDLGGTPLRLRVFFNTGAGFEPKPTILTDAFPSVSRRIQVVLGKHPNQQTRNGWSVFQRRSIDLDQDGLLDVAVIAPPADGQKNPWLVPGAHEPAALGGDAVSPAETPEAVVAPAPPEGEPPSTPGEVKPPTAGEFVEPEELAPLETPAAVAHFNVGDRLIRSGSTTALASWRAALARIQLAVAPGGNDGVWKVKTDLMDFDGDGLTDLFNNDALDPRIHCNPGDDGNITGLCGHSAEVLSDGASVGSGRARGFRLLASVNNGRGATVRFNYAAGTEESIVETAPERGRRNPGAIWVVSSLSVDLEHGPSATTDYRYRFPVLNRDRKGHLGFRGFEEVVIRHPENAQGARRTTVEKYDYDLDFSGLLVDRIVRAGSQTVVRIESMQWQRMELFRGQVLAFHPRETQIRICDSTNDQVEAACRKKGALRREIKAWAPVLKRIGLPVAPAFDALASEALQPDSAPNVFDPGLSNRPPDRPDHRPESDKLCSPAAPSPPNSRAVLYVNCGERLTDRLGRAVRGDRGVLWSHQLLYDSNTYHLLGLEERKIVASGDGTSSSWGAVQLRGLARTVYDESRLGLPIENHVALEDSTEAVTRTTFDLSTGNVTGIQRPNQVAASSSLETRLFYEPFQIYAGTILNEVGHLVSTTTDVATGDVTLNEGPHQPGVGLPRKRVTYDGLGRVRERFRSVDKEGGGLEEKVYARTTYFDHENPVRIRTQEVIEYDGDRSVTTDRTYDGLGRLLAEAVATDLGPATTRYAYDLAGNLVGVSVPNPRGDDHSDTLFRFEHDAMGRVTRWVPPLGAPLRITYNGLEHSRSEMPQDGSTPKPVRLAHDVFGRVVEVIEQSREGNAATGYRYDANDNLRRVTDADGVVTELDHDLAGRRIAVRRGDRTWQYGYDHEGNRVAETAPHLSSDTKEAFTTRYTYDALGRLRSRSPGIRNLTAAQRARYRVGPTLYEYDLPTHRNTVGRLARVSLPFGTVEYQYSAEGWPTEERRRFEIDPFGTGPIADDRVRLDAYNALGQPVRQRHADNTTSVTEYDERGLTRASFVELDSTPRSAAPSRLLLARLTRNRSGIPIRRSAFGQEQEWQYDDLGRVAGHRILSDSTVVGGEAAVYDDVGNLTSLTNQGAQVTLRFAYDTQHQLIGAQSSPPGVYVAEYRYSPAGKVLRAKVQSLNESMDVFPRDVIHHYVGSPPADPGAVRRLMPGDGSPTPRATYEYDESGNLVERTIDSEAWKLVYDSYDEMREAAFSSHSGPARREVYYYDHDGGRMLTAREMFGQESGEIRLWFGGDETTYDLAGHQIGSVSYVTLDVHATAQIIDSQRSAPQLNYRGVLQHLLGTFTSAGQLTSGFAYGPYGEMLSEEGQAAEASRRRFNGKEFDELTGLSYYGFRYYDRTALAWTQSDPLSRFAPDASYDEPRRTGLYTFVLNNPLRFVDPDGRQETPVDAGPSEDSGPSGLPLCQDVAGPVSDCIAAPIPPIRDPDPHDVLEAKLLGASARSAVEEAMTTVVDMADFGFSAAQTIITLGLCDCGIGDWRQRSRSRFEGVEDRYKAAEQKAWKNYHQSKSLGGETAATSARKLFSKEKQALLDMARKDKRKGITPADMKAYKDLNKGLPDPFPSNKVRGPEAHPSGGPHSQRPHGHVGSVDHIPIRDPK